MLDSGLTHMNGRLYDPLLARFVSADPHVDNPFDLQSLNRYSYVNNNPLGFTDPTGYFKLFGKKWSWWRDKVVKPIAQIAICATTGQLGCAVTTSAFALANGATPGQASKAGVINFLTSQAFNLAGDKAPTGLPNVVAHAAVGCVSASASGGQCRQGALSAAAGSLWTNYAPDLGNLTANLVAHAVVGGTASVLGGGKFENGAMTASFGYLFNCLAHDCLKHYVEGGGKPLTARFDELGAENVTPEMFKQVRGLTVAGMSDGEYAINDTLGWQTESLNARAAYGRVRLQLQGSLTVSQGSYSFSGSLSAPPDPYNFDPKPWGQRTFMGEVSTRAGALLPGRAFNNVFVGDRLLRSGGALR